MGKDTLPQRVIKEAVIHEPKKGLLPKKSCLKKRVDSFSPAASPVNEVPTHNREDTARTSGEAVAASESKREEELHDDILTARIRQDADLPRDRGPRRNCTQHPDAGPCPDREQTHSSWLLLKRKREEADEANDRSEMDESFKMAKTSKEALRKYIRQKVQEANRTLALEDMTFRLN